MSNSWFCYCERSGNARWQRGGGGRLSKYKSARDLDSKSQSSKTSLKIQKSNKSGDGTRSKYAKVYICYDFNS